MRGRGSGRGMRGRGSGRGRKRKGREETEGCCEGKKVERGKGEREERPSYPVFLHVLDPLNGLSLRIDHERPAIASGHDHAILSGETVRGKALDVPVSNRSRLPQEGGKGEVWRARNVQLSNLKDWNIKVTVKQPSQHRRPAII
jgi:hypothetical protein